MLLAFPHDEMVGISLLDVPGQIFFRFERQVVAGADPLTFGPSAIASGLDTAFPTLVLEVVSEHPHLDRHVVLFSTMKFA